LIQLIGLPGYLPQVNTQIARVTNIIREIKMLCCTRWVGKRGDGLKDLLQS
jgi:hypothetical protein